VLFCTSVHLAKLHMENNEREQGRRRAGDSCWSWTWPYLQQPRDAHGGHLVQRQQRGAQQPQRSGRHAAAAAAALVGCAASRPPAAGPSQRCDQSRRQEPRQQQAAQQVARPQDVCRPTGGEASISGTLQERYKAQRACAIQQGQMQQPQRVADDAVWMIVNAMAVAASCSDTG
jgi:hypothetical protein